MTLFCSCDLDLDPMTLTYEPELDIVKMYMPTKMKFICQGILKLDLEWDIGFNVLLDAL